MSPIDPESPTPPHGVPALETAEFAVHRLSLAFGPYPGPAVLSLTDGDGRHYSYPIPDTNIAGTVAATGITVKGTPASWCNVIHHMRGATAPGTFPRVVLTFDSPARSLAIQADFR